MKYSVENLKTVPQCESLVSQAASKRKILGANLIFAEHAISKSLEAHEKMEEKFEKLTSELALIESISKLTGPETEPDVFTKRMLKLQLRLYTLETSRSAYSMERVLEKELHLAILLQEAEAVDAFIAAIEKRKASLKKKA